MIDIVKRLRLSVTKGHEPTDDDAIDAADEIERLRATIEQLDPSRVEEPLDNADYPQWKPRDDPVWKEWKERQVNANSPNSRTRLGKGEKNTKKTRI